MLIFTAHVAQAGTPPANYTFGAQVLTGDYASTMGMGYVDYDPAFLSGGLDQLFPEGGLLGLSLTILGQSFSMGDDAEYPLYPVVDFDSYMPTYLDFIVEEDGVEILEPNVVSISLGEVIGGVGPGSLCPDIDNGNGCHDYYVEAFIEVAPAREIPIPAALWLFGSGLLALGGVSRRKKMN